MLLDKNNSCLIIVDIQERLAPAMYDGGQEAIRNAGILMQAARRLGVPALVSEQYPRGLGRTVPQLAEYMPAGGPIEKLEFACPNNAGFSGQLKAFGKKQIVIGGMEAHICVLQTALKLCDQGLEVFVAADAVASRKQSSMERAFARIEDAGGAIITTEMAVFEWLEQAGTDDFKVLSKLIQ
ncbi:MAG: hydrolase [Alphaproteobacteria bacterium]|nr:hydrolase [Alphaproteobacteria bacterium]